MAQHHAAVGWVLRGASPLCLGAGSAWLYVGLAAGGPSPFLFFSSWLLHALLLHVQEGDAAWCAHTRPGDPGVCGAEKGKGKDPGWVEGPRNTGYSG